MGTELMRQDFPVQGRNFDRAGEVASEIKVILKELGIDSEIIRRVVVVSFEAEMNVTMYATKGVITFVLTDSDIELTIADEGPGIPDTGLAMQEGYSTASDEMREMGFGFGMGLPNMKRNSDFFKLESVVNKGTTVSSKIGHNASA